MNFIPKDTPEALAAAMDDEHRFYPKHFLVRQALNLGISVFPPCIQNGFYHSAVQEKSIYLGFRHVLKLDEETAHLIPLERSLNGHYKSIEDFIQRTQIHPETLLVLIKSGAFRWEGICKKDLFQRGCQVLGKQISKEALSLLFDPQQQKFVFAQGEESFLELLYDELETLGFPVSGCISELLFSGLKTSAKAFDWKKYTGKKLRIAGAFISEKHFLSNQRLSSEKSFFCSFDGSLIDCFYFPESEADFLPAENEPYLISGTVKDHSGFPALEMDMMGKLPLRPDPRGITS